MQSNAFQLEMEIMRNQCDDNTQCHRTQTQRTEVEAFCKWQMTIVFCFSRLKLSKNQGKVVEIWNLLSTISIVNSVFRHKF